MRLLSGSEWLKIAQNEQNIRLLFGTLRAYIAKKLSNIYLYQIKIQNYQEKYSRTQTIKIHFSL